MNIETTNSIPASTYTIDPAAIGTDENAKRQGESKTEVNSFGKSVGDSIRISDDARVEKDKKAIEELEKIDRQVQQHEAAHQAAAGELFRGKSFSYRVGPDGKRYAVAGEVHIDTSAVTLNPKATIAKMERIRRAATAPSDPSAQDMSVAAEAAKIEADAKAQLQQQYFAESNSQTQTAPAIGGTTKEAATAISSVMKSQTENNTGSNTVLAPNMQVSILFNTPAASLLSSPKTRIDLIF
ncbi:MAG TPA: putative metalloprotease CJM1_0395 family protein [Ignavibacteriales bacterium]|nr:putative metalloprotease CJM1_0395 family protein [Ignavibacteriales bacterium]